MVWVDRDKTPKLPKRFRVSAYPSLLALGQDGENLHRFQSFKRPKDFIPELEKALVAARKYRNGKEWTAVTTRATALTSEAQVSRFKAPGDELPGGMHVLGNDLLLAQGRKIYTLDPQTGKLYSSIPLRRNIQDLTSDGLAIYTVDSRWGAGSPIQVLDPQTGKLLREIVTEANRDKRDFGSRGIAWMDGKLYVLGIYGKIHQVDPKTGHVLTSFDIGRRWTFGLVYDGAHLVTVSRSAMHLIDPKTGKVVRDVPMNYRLRAVGWHKGRHLVMEQPIFGFGQKHERVQVWPRPASTVIYSLDLLPVKNTK